MLRRKHFMPILLAAALLGGCANTGVVLRSARAQQHTAVVLAYLDTLHNRQEAGQAAHLYLAPAFHDHSPGTRAEGRIEILHTVAQGDLVSVHLRTVAAPGDTQVALLELYRLYQGRIVDRWAMSGPDDTLPGNAPKDPPENHIPMQPRSVR